MDVVVDSDQIRRLGFNILDRIYGPLKKHLGVQISLVYVDNQGNPRIGVQDSIFYDKTVFMLKEDFLKFKAVIPLDEITFANIYKAWLERNYGINNFGKLTTIYPDKMNYVPEYRNKKTNFSY